MKKSPNESLETDVSVLEQHTVLAKTLKKRPDQQSHDKRMSNNTYNKNR